MIQGDISLFLKALGAKEKDPSFKKAFDFIGGEYETDIYTDTGEEEKYLIMENKGVEFLLRNSSLSTIFFHVIEEEEGQGVYKDLSSLIKRLKANASSADIEKLLGAPLRSTEKHLTYEAKPGYVQFDFADGKLKTVVAMTELIGGVPAQTTQPAEDTTGEDDLMIFLRAVGTTSYSPEHLAAVVHAGPAMESEKAVHAGATWIYQSFPKSGVLFQFKNELAVRVSIELHSSDESPAYRWLDRLIPALPLPASRESIQAHFGEPFQSNEHMDLYYIEDRYLRFYFEKGQSTGITITQPGANLQYIRDNYRQLEWGSTKNNKPTHITQMNGSSRGALLDTIRPYRDQIRFSLNRMNGSSYWAYSLWRAPKDANLLHEIPLSDEYIQSAGTAERMTIEVRIVDAKGVANQYVVGKPNGTQTGNPTEEISWDNGRYAMKVYSNEVFTADEAAEVYYNYFLNNKVDTTYSLRDINVNEPDPSNNKTAGSDADSGSTGPFIYTDKIGAGPEHPDKRWGLFSTELTPSRAAIRYGLNAVRRSRWFGVVLLKPGEKRPRAYLQVCPRANGVELNQVNEHGSIVASYIWRAYYTPSKNVPYTGNEDKVFLSSYTTYVYPKKAQFFRRNQSVGHVDLTFNPNGDIKQELVIPRGFGEPSNVETEEYHGVDVTENWLKIPEFGDWDGFFNPPVWDEE